MDPVEALARLGGVATVDRLLTLTTRKRLRRAVEHREVVRIARGTYRLPAADEALAAAARLGGAVALRSAALAHGWSVKTSPHRPEIAIARNRRPPHRPPARLLWVPDLDPRAGVRSPLETVLDCARRLPFDEALTIADSALRSRMITQGQLREAADRCRGAGAAAVRRVAMHATGKAANPFESVLRAIAIEEGHRFIPQHAIDLGSVTVHPDLVDPVRRIVLEADSWEWHTGKQAHVRDCWRYNALVLHSWLVIRFAWEHVMLDDAYVRSVLRDLGPAGQAEVRPEARLSRVG